MSLSEVRKEINSIDDSMKKLFNQRMECSNQVAAVKLAESDKVFKPLREKEICERFADDEEYLVFIKKVMQISRKRQYGIFCERKVPNRVSDKLEEAKSLIVDKGLLELNLRGDENAEKGLDVKDIISIIADTSLSINSLNVDDAGNVKVSLKVMKDDRSKKEALTLAYMLYEETII